MNKRVGVCIHLSRRYKYLEKIGVTVMEPPESSLFTSYFYSTSPTTEMKNEMAKTQYQGWYTRNVGFNAHVYVNLMHGRLSRHAYYHMQQTLCQVIFLL